MTWQHTQTTRGLVVVALVFADFRIEAVKTRYSISAAKSQEAGEVLISNFKA